MTLTRAGALALIAGTTLSCAGVVFESPPASMFGAALLVALALARLSVAPPQLDARRDVSARVAREGETLHVDLVLTPRGRLASGRIAAEDARDPALTLAAGSATATGRLHLAYDVVPQVCGLLALGPVRVRYRDPLGLVEHQAELDARTELAIHPSLGTELPTFVESGASITSGGPYAVGQAGPGADFFALREFQDGDSIRDVNWRASARAGGKLVVNQREKESNSRVLVFLDGRALAQLGTRRVNGWVASLRAAARIAHAHERRKDRARVAVYGGDALLVSDGKHGEPTALLDSAIARGARGHRDLARAVGEILPTLRPKMPVVVISSLLDDTSAPEAVGALIALEQRVTVLVVDAAALIELANVDAPARLRAQRETVARVRTTGARVIEWDPRTELGLVILQEVRT